MTAMPRRGDVIAFRPYHRAVGHAAGERRSEVTHVSGNFVEVYRGDPGTRWYAWHNGTLAPAHRDQRGELVEDECTFSPSLLNVRVVGRWFPDPGELEGGGSP